MLDPCTCVVTYLIFSTAMCMFAFERSLILCTYTQTYVATYVHRPLCTIFHSTCFCSPSYVCLVFFSGNWLNKFMADFQVTNPSNERLAVTDITGHYMDEGVL